MSSTSFKATTSTTTHESRSMSMDTMELDEADLPPHQDFTEPIQGSLSPSPPSSSSSTLTALEIQQLKHAIQNAQSLAEIQRLEEALHSGILPSSLASFPHSSSPTSHDMEEEEEEEEEKEPLQDPIQAHPMDPSET
ncbi:hypothetical protein HMI54_000584 [Coelomomyces lativittatus]|nr:hypothetical protein HMI54_000584 [Coelomomyces lativittatus]